MFWRTLPVLLGCVRLHVVTAFEPVDYWTKRTSKTEFLGIKRDFIEQNKHLLCNRDSCDCNQMKIIKGKWFNLLLFQTFVTPLLGLEMFVCFCKQCAVRMVCFRLKAFLKSDTAAGLTRSSSLSRCITLVFFDECLTWVFLYFWIWRFAISPDVIEVGNLHHCVKTQKDIVLLARLKAPVALKHLPSAFDVYYPNDYLQYFLHSPSHSETTSVSCGESRQLDYLCLEC